MARPLTPEASLPTASGGGPSAGHVLHSARQLARRRDADRATNLPACARDFTVICAKECGERPSAAFPTWCGALPCARRLRGSVLGDCHRAAPCAKLRTGLLMWQGPKGLLPGWCCNSQEGFVMCCPDASDSFPEGRRQPPRRRRRRIELLNACWHNPAGTHSPGSCPACGANIGTDDRADYMDGALYHVRCLPDRPGTPRAHD
jgi:hypothetical protein